MRQSTVKIDTKRARLNPGHPESEDGRGQLAGALLFPARLALALVHVVDEEDQDEGHPEECDRREDGSALVEVRLALGRGHGFPLGGGALPRGVPDRLHLVAPLLGHEGQEGVEAEGEQLHLLVQVPVTQDNDT